MINTKFIEFDDTYQRS